MQRNTTTVRGVHTVLLKILGTISQEAERKAPVTD